MEGQIIDVVMLGLLVTFFGIQQRHRPELYFRLWFAGWIFAFLNFVLWIWHPSAPLLLAVRYTVRVDSVYLGGLAFLLSFVVDESHKARAAWLALSVALPAAILLQVVHLPHAGFAVLFVLVLALESAFIHLIFAMVPPRWPVRRIALGLLAVLSGVVLVVLARAGKTSSLEEWTLGQVFLSAAILYSATGNRRSMEWLIGTLDFVLWGAAYPLHELFASSPRLLLLLSAFWSLPKYAVGFAMILRIFWNARRDVVQIADRYKDLYADFRMLYEHHPLPMWIYDSASTRILTANAAAIENYGYTQDEFLGMSVQHLSLPPEPAIEPPAQMPAHPPITQSTLIEGLGLAEIADAPASPEAANRIRHFRKNGTALAVELTQNDILFQGRQARFVLAVDVTERDRLNEQLNHRAQHDVLTSLPNRMLLEDRIEQSLLRATRTHKKAALFTIDADRFKLINDTYGHLVGDEALKAIADRLRSRIRSVDTIGRTGGEEFTAIVGGLNQAEDAEKVAAVFVRLFDTPLLIGELELKVSVSVGAAIFPDDAAESETLRKKSDQALYHAKRCGRNRFAFASTEVCASFDQSMAVELALRQALRNNALDLHFQPLFDDAGRVVHFEALLRMSPHNAAIYEPSLFIPIAEECGLILPIGNWVVEQACRHLVEWRRLGSADASVALNVSGRQLLQKGFGAFLLETLRAHQLPPTALQLELTESSLMSDPSAMRDAMAELAESGIRFAIDDFGTGYSSLSRLVELPISLLKIDRSFVSQLDRANRSEGIVTAIIQMGRTLQVQVVAEGVETEAQLNLLLRHGCDLFQGFHLARPVPAGQIDVAIECSSSDYTAHPAFSQTRAAVSKRVRAAQLPALAGVGAA